MVNLQQAMFDYQRVIDVNGVDIGLADLLF